MCRLPDATVANGDAVAMGVDMETVLASVSVILAVATAATALLGGPGGIPLLEVGVAQHVEDDVVAVGGGRGLQKVVGVVEPSLLLLGRAGDVSHRAIVVAVAAILVDTPVCPGPLPLVPPPSAAADAAGEGRHGDHQEDHAPHHADDDVIVERGSRHVGRCRNSKRLHCRERRKVKKVKEDTLFFPKQLRKLSL